MIRVRTVTSITDFVGSPGDPPTYADQIQHLWDTGASRPSWCFVLEDEGGRLGRLGFRVAATCPPDYLGDLPPDELFGFGWSLPWASAEAPSLADRLFGAALGAISGDVPELVQLRINAEFHEPAARRAAVALGAGFELFQEKQGHVWREDGRPVAVPDRLEFLTVVQSGTERYRRVLAACGEKTLDRNDTYYRTLAGPDNWGAVFMSALEDEDAASWLLGVGPDGEIGFVALSAFDEPATATITFIGVLPEHRGQGYVDDLLAAGTAAAQHRGFAQILSDVDVENAPMIAAMERNGHRSGRRPWHVWHLRRQIAAAL